MAGMEIQPTLTYRAEAFKGGEKFLFTLLKVESLPDKDCLGSDSDAYFRIKVPGNSTRKTPPILDSINPVWERDNSFVFRGGVGTEIELICMDWDPEGYDDDLVTGTIELTDAILDGEDQTVVLKLEDNSSSSEEADEKDENGDVSSQLRRPRTRKRPKGRPNRNRNQGRIRQVDTGRGFRRQPGAKVVMEESANHIQDAWLENKDALVNGFEGNIGASANTTGWNGRGKYRNLRLDLQSRDKVETRFAFQEHKGVHGQVHLVEQSIPETVGNGLKATALWGAMRMSLKKGSIVEVRGD